MKRNLFTAALEAEAGTVDIAQVTELSTLQPKPGFTEDKSLTEVNVDDVKVDKAFGEDADIAEHDEIDTVAESQEHTLALEHLQTMSMRYCRMAAALEEIAEQAEASLAPAEQSAEEVTQGEDAGEPVPAASGDGLTPETVSLLTTAIDAAGVGEPLSESVALEAFGFDQRVATESFIDNLRERAEKVYAAAAKFMKKAFELTAEKLKRFADYFRGTTAIYAKLEKEAGILASVAGKPFQNAKWEKAVQERFYAPSSTKSPIAAVENSIAEFNELLKIVNRVSSDMHSLSQAWVLSEPKDVVNRMNAAITSAKPLAEVGRSKFQHSSVVVEVNLPERLTVEGSGGMEGQQVTFEEGKHEFSAGIKCASAADVTKLKETAGKADRAIDMAINALFEIGDDSKTRPHRSGGGDDAESARRLLSKYSHLMRLLSDLVAGTTFGSAHGLYFNHFGASRWIRFSISEAKAAARGAK
jgi:hypothetical protein